MESLNAQEVAEALGELVECAEDTNLEGSSWRTFEDAGVLTRDAGLVLRLADGAEFQVTVVRSR